MPPKNCADLRIGGLQPLTTIDYPGQLAAIVFTQGCPWRCCYCHNPELLPARQPVLIPWQQVADFLLARVGLLDAVVFSGGEPTAQSGLLAAVLWIREHGFKVGLHTAGIYPKQLQKLLPYIDWIGLDIKAPEADYAAITGVRNSGERAWQSAEIVLASGVNYQFRITAHPHWLDQEQVEQTRDRLALMGSTNTVIQQGRLTG